MNATRADLRALYEGFVGELTDAALEVAAARGVRGASVDHEVRLWRALRAVFRQGGGRRRKDLLADLTDAAYRALLGYGLAGPFLDLELALWRAFRRTAREGRFAPPFLTAAAC
jgi:hypothetical protein